MHRQMGPFIQRKADIMISPRDQASDHHTAWVIRHNAHPPRRGDARLPLAPQSRHDVAPA
jgi:hypothetical protein